MHTYGHRHHPCANSLVYPLRRVSAAQMTCHAPLPPPRGDDGHSGQPQSSRDSNQRGASLVESKGCLLLTWGSGARQYFPEGLGDNLAFVTLLSLGFLDSAC